MITWYVVLMQGRVVHGVYGSKLLAQAMKFASDRGATAFVEEVRGHSHESRPRIGQILPYPADLSEMADVLAARVGRLAARAINGEPFDTRLITEANDAINAAAECHRNNDRSQASDELHRAIELLDRVAL